MGVNQGIAGIAVQAVQAIRQAVHQGRQPLFYKSQTARAVLGRHAVPEQNYLGGMGIDFNHIVAGGGQLPLETDGPVNQLADDGTLIGKKAADAHTGHFQLRLPPLLLRPGQKAGAGGL